MITDEMKKKSPEVVVAPFPDYCWADTAMGDVTHRNNVQRVDAIIPPDPPRECYVGMFRFKEEYRHHVSKTGSVKGAGGLPCHCDHLWFDIDNADLEMALGYTKELLARLEAKYDIQMSSMAIFFSGSKGYHVGIPSQMFGAQPSVNLPNIFKRMAVELAGDIPIDTAIYERNRLWRLPNSINVKSGLFKIPLTYKELTQLDSDAIKKLAATKRELQPTTSIDCTPNEGLTTLYDKVIGDLNQPKSIVKADSCTQYP